MIILLINIHILINFFIIKKKDVSTVGRYLVLNNVTYVNRKKNILIDTFPPRMYAKRDLLNTPEEFLCPWGHKLDIMLVEMHFQLPKNNWKDIRVNF